MSSENNHDRAKKKAYHQPELHIYGNINRLTASIGGNGNIDGGSGSNNRSQPGFPE